MHVVEGLLRWTGHLLLSLAGALAFGWVWSRVTRGSRRVLPKPWQRRIDAAAARYPGPVSVVVVFGLFTAVAWALAYGCLCGYIPSDTRSTAYFAAALFFACGAGTTFFGVKIFRNVSKVGPKAP